ncbi:MAG: hypothetical protein ACLRIP_16535 [Blautia massiliensis (ex Durand et al. 2017)]
MVETRKSIQKSMGKCIGYWPIHRGDSIVVIQPIQNSIVKRKEKFLSMSKMFMNECEEVMGSPEAIRSPMHTS